MKYKNKKLKIIVLIVLVIICLSTFGKSKDMERIDWDEISLSQVLPDPKLKKGKIIANTKEEIFIYLYKADEDKFINYKDKCIDVGFDIDYEENTNSYEAYNSEGYKLDLTYFRSDKEMRIELYAPIDTEVLYWPNSEPAKLLPVPKSTLGKFEWENSKGFFVYIANMSFSDYKEYVNICEERGFDIDYSKGDSYYYADHEEGYHIYISYEGFNIMSVKIDLIDDFDSEESKKETLIETVTKESTPTVSTTEKTTLTTTIETTTEIKVVLKKNEIQIPKSSSGYSYVSDYTKVVEELKELGFKNIECKASYELSSGWFASLKENNVKSISIDEKTEFDVGEIFNLNDKVVIVYKAFEYKDPTIKYKKYSVSNLIKDLDENALKAKNSHTGEFVEITGKVGNIDAGGDCIELVSNNIWEFRTITCLIQNDEQLEKIMAIKKNDTITVKGRIILVGETLGYTMELYII